MSRWNLSWILGIVGVALVGLSLTYSAPQRDLSLTSKHQNLKLLVEVLEEVQHKYVKELTGDQMRDLVENMVNSGLERLDPHSAFINQDEFRQFQKNSKGRFGGIGIRIGLDRNGQVLVESPMVGTPAYEAGILAGDIIAKIDGHVVDSNTSLKKVVEMIQGEPGTKVKIGVLHEGGKKIEEYDITRAEIAVESILGDQRMADNLKEWNYWVDPDKKIAYLRITNFSETTVTELVKTVQVLQKADMKGLVIDLRNNPGGLLKAAVEVSSLFLPEGKAIVNTKGRNNIREDNYAAKHDFISQAPVTKIPVAILVNRYSASASEIVAAALQDWARAVVVGERTFGKGSVQNVIPMENQTSALKLTTASYWRPSGKNIHRFPDSKDEDDWGVKPTPGYEVKLTDEERIEYMKWRRDRDIIRRAGKEPAKDDAQFKDKVLERALDYIREELSKKQG